MHDRTCPECSAVFSPRTGGQVCCSDKCKRERQKRQTRERAAANDEAKKASRELLAREAAERQERRIRRRRADLAYKQLAVPVSRHVENGVSVEWRGQPRLGCCAVGVVNHNA